MSIARTTATAGAARDRSVGSLRLVPYLHGREQVPLEEAARVIGVPPEQLEKDLRVLFLCGLPGGYPDDLIDVDLEALEGEGLIRVSIRSAHTQMPSTTPTCPTSSTTSGTARPTTNSWSNRCCCRACWNSPRARTRPTW